jgi:membrane protein involved in colicin uptake
VVNTAPAPTTPAANPRSAERDAAKAEAKAAEQKKTEQAVSRAIPRGATGTAAAKAAAEKADEAAADSAAATTIEAQQAAQNLALGLMGFNPAFAAYQNAIVPDINAAVMARQYNQPTVDNRSALRQLSGASDRLHQDMVDQQYGRMPR